MGGGLEVESIPSQGMRTRRSEAYHHIGGGLEGEKHPITLEEDWKVSSIPLQGRRTGREVASLHRVEMEGKKRPFTEEDWKRSSIPSKGRRTGRREASLNRGGRFLHPYNHSLYRCLFDGQAVPNHCMVRIMYIFILPCFIVHYFLVTFQRETCESSEHFCYQMIHGEGAQRTEIRECWDLAYEVRGIRGQRSGSYRIWSMR